MNEPSILKRTLLLTGKLVGVFSIWVALVTLAAVAAADRMVVAMSGSSADKGEVVPAETIKKDEGVSPLRKNPPVNPSHKPNG